MGRRGVSRPPSQHRTPRAPWSSPNGSAQTPPNRNPAAPTHATRSPSPSAPRPGNPAEWTTSSAAQTTPCTPASPPGETTFNSPPRTQPTRQSAPNTQGRAAARSSSSRCEKRSSWDSAPPRQSTSCSLIREDECVAAGILRHLVPDADPEIRNAVIRALSDTHPHTL